MALTHALSTNNYGPAHLIVATSAAQGTHTTLASAMADAVAGDTIFLRDSVTENVTLTPGVNINAWNSSITSTVSITGKLSMTGAGTCTISNITLITNSDFFLAVTGSANSVVNLKNCFLYVNNNTGISFTSSGVGTMINIEGCQGDIATTGITYFALATAGSMFVENCHLEDRGNSLTNITISQGLLFINHSRFVCPGITTTSTGAFQIQNCDILVPAGINNTMLTHGGSTTNCFVYNSFIGSGTSSAISIGSTLIMGGCVVDSSNTNAITGAGTLVNAGISFSNTSSKINTTTQTARNLDVGGISFDGGTNVLSNYTEGTFTPTLFGSTVTGATTYSTQTGYYRRIGNLVVVQGAVIGSAATGTGNATIGALPFTLKNQTAGNAYGTLLTANAAGWTWTALTTSIFLAGSLNTVTGVIQSSGTGAGFGNLQMNNSAFNFQFTLSYEI